jgi:hypothetical protein
MKTQVLKGSSMECKIRIQGWGTINSWTITSWMEKTLGLRPAYLLKGKSMLLYLRNLWLVEGTRKINNIEIIVYTNRISWILKITLIRLQQTIVKECFLLWITKRCINNSLLNIRKWSTSITMGNLIKCKIIMIHLLCRKGILNSTSHP